MRVHKLVLAAVVAAAFAGGILAAQFGLDLGGASAQPDADAAPELRVQARALEDGRVEVAVQQRGADGAWGERQLPERRFVPSDAPANRWLSSSALGSSAAASAASVAAKPLHCVIGHGHADDYFWAIAQSYSERAGRELGINLRWETHLHGAEQAAAIRACSADGAAVIAATLADPQAVTPALQEADEAGARIITFNSGAEFAHEAGSELHISIDDHATGRLAGERFNAAEVDGEIVCLIHEDVNTGLDERCDGLAETYAGGAVRPLHIPDDYDREQTTQFAIDLLRGEGAPAGILALNVDTTLAVMEALSRLRGELDYRPIVGSIGGHPDISRLPLDLRNDHLAFLTNDLGPAQGYLITAALQMVQEFHVPERFVTGTSILKAVPFVINSGAARAADNADALRDLVEASDRLGGGEDGE